MDYLKKANVAVNILFIIAAVVGGTLLVKHYLSNPGGGDKNIYQGRPERPLSKNISVGNKLEVPGVNWTSNHSLVFVLSTGCGFCQASAPFYQRLVSALAHQKQIKTVALLPQPVSVSQEYLNKTLRINVDEVEQAAPPAMGIMGTPTLLLLDKDSTIQNYWLGQLTPQQEEEVFQRLKELTTTTNALEPGDSLDKKGAEAANASQEKQNAPPSSNTEFVTKSDLKNLKDSPAQSTIILDVRNRSEYRAGHLEGAKNMPGDEIEVRAPEELSRDSLIVIYCQCQQDDAPAHMAQKILSSYGYRTKIFKPENGDKKP